MSFISTEKTIESFTNSKELQVTFETLYQYVLYVCRGDFTSFDNMLLLEKNLIEETKNYELNN